jgi:hypothetical protein
MTRCSKILTLAGALLLVSAMADVGRAQYPAGCLYPYNYGSVYGSYGRGLPPYFSLFPPVYYSYPVPRTYGYSPFAYPAGTPTPEIQIEPVQAKLMVNPFVPRSEVTKPATDQMTGGPYTLVNPFASSATPAIVARR